jgi:hypothetical protein
MSSFKHDLVQEERILDNSEERIFLPASSRTLSNIIYWNATRVVSSMSSPTESHKLKLIA